MYKAWRNFYELFQDVNEFSLLILNLLEKTILKYCLWERRVISFSVSEGFWVDCYCVGIQKAQKVKLDHFSIQNWIWSPHSKIGSDFYAIITWLWKFSQLQTPFAAQCSLAMHDMTGNKTAVKGISIIRKKDFMMYKWACLEGKARIWYCTTDLQHSIQTDPTSQKPVALKDSVFILQLSVNCFFY